jgi:hypothetical protein
MAKKVLTPEEEEELRLSERKRVDEFMAKAKADRRAAGTKSQERKYPGVVSLMGQGFQNLYDSLSEREVSK